MYRSLDAEKIAETVSRLRDRIQARFPDSSLNLMAAELLEVARESHTRADWVSRPIWWLRIGITLLIVIMLATLVASIRQIQLPAGVHDLVSLLQAMESGINDVVLIGAGIYFLMGLESRLKRKVVLKAIHELRSLAHIVDTHQLTKDPEQLLRGGETTQVSPRRAMTPFELARYLDYCTEMLSLIGKLAALHVQHFTDADTMNAVDDIEDLTIGLSRKIWQKIALIGRN